jgi:hypothetical protein
MPDTVEVQDTDIEMSYGEPGETNLAVEAHPVEWVELPDATSLRAHIFAQQDIQEELVAIPEWKTKILVRGLNAKTRAKILQDAMRKDGTPDLERMYPNLVIATARHPVSKDHIFQQSDMVALNEKAGGVLERLAMTAARLSGLDGTSQQAMADNFRP